MPIYEYACSDCGEETEVIRKANEAPLGECPACHSSSLRRKTSMTFFRLKGGGWYKDGYVKNNSKNREIPKSDGNPKDKSGEKSERPVYSKAS